MGSQAALKQPHGLTNAVIAHALGLGPKCGRGECGIEPFGFMVQTQILDVCNGKLDCEGFCLRCRSCATPPPGARNSAPGRVRILTPLQRRWSPFSSVSGLLFYHSASFSLSNFVFRHGARAFPGEDNRCREPRTPHSWEQQSARARVHTHMHSR